MPPNRCSKWLDPKCVHGDSGKEPYLVSHHLLLAHAATVQVYRKKYQVHHNSHNNLLGSFLRFERFQF